MRCEDCTEWEYFEGYGYGCFCMKTMTPIDANKCEFYTDKRPIRSGKQGERMTNDDAIKHIQNILRGREDKRGKTDADAALEMAISALKRQALDDARKDFMDDVYNTLDFLPTNDEANRIIDSFDRVISKVVSLYEH